LGNIIKIRLLPTASALANSLKNADDVADDLTSTAGKEVANRLKELLRAPLAKHPAGIGASGKSYSSVRYRKGSTSKGRAEYIIYEDGSGANEKIRKGIKPGEQGSIASLREWAISKRLSLVHPDNFKTGSGTSTGTQRELLSSGRDSKPVSYISPSQKRRIRPYKRDEDKFTAAISAIYRALDREGTNREPNPPVMGANWWRYYPEGQGRFDYVAYVIRTKQPEIRSMISDASRDVKSGIINYVLSGRKSGGMSMPITINRYKG